MHPSGIVEQVRRSIVIAKKDIMIYYIKGPVIIFGLLIPLFLFMAFSVGSRFASLPFLISGLLAMTSSSRRRLSAGDLSLGGPGADA